MVQQYLDHCKEILTSPITKFDFNERRQVGRLSLFGYQNRYDLKEGFPLATTKNVHFKSLAHELIWFFKGTDNIKYLVDNNVHIWDEDGFQHYLVKHDMDKKIKKYSDEWVGMKKEYVGKIKEDDDFAEKEGSLGPVYGPQWIHSPEYFPVEISFEIDGKPTQLYRKSEEGINQLEKVIEGMKKSPRSSRHIVSAWNPSEVAHMALPPCHTLFQFNSDGKQLDLQLFQRSADEFLGVPFNIASYAMVTQIFANELDFELGDFVHTFGDSHIYCGTGKRAKWYERNFSELKERVKAAGKLSLHKGGEYKTTYQDVLSWIEKNAPEEATGPEGKDHVTAVLEQMTREPKELPKLEIANKKYNELEFEDFNLLGYDPEPRIKRAMAV